MQDVALPLMCDKRWEEDTLFLVFEEDFRFTNDDDSEPVFIKARQLQEVVGEEEPSEDLSGRKKVPIGFSNKVHGTSLVCFLLVVWLQQYTIFKQLSSPPLLQTCFVNANT